MISFEEARRRIAQHTRPLGTQDIPLQDALGRVLARDIVSPIPLPLFNNAAMDGFVLRHRDTRSASKAKPVSIKITGLIQAGNTGDGTLKAGQACRIMTGAKVPSGGDTVLPIEQAHLHGDCLVLTEPCNKAQHIRKRGEELHKGTITARKGSVLSPGAIGSIASLGRHKVRVYQVPRVAILVTGNELVRPGATLRNGQIYESNTFMLQACLQQMRLKPGPVRRVRDTKHAVRTACALALQKADVLLLSGGVSVGDYDYVKEVLDMLGVKKIFWRVAQKPGKPLYFGKKGKQLVFGLPGNPAAVFTCFYEHVYPSLRRMCGFAHADLPRQHLPLATNVRPDTKRLHFLKAKILACGDGTAVTPLTGQDSHMIASLCRADCFIVTRPADAFLKKGASVEVHRLPVPTGGA